MTEKRAEPDKQSGTEEFTGLAAPSGVEESVHAGQPGFIEGGPKVDELSNVGNTVHVEDQALVEGHGNADEPPTTESLLDPNKLTNVEELEIAEVSETEPKDIEAPTTVADSSEAAKLENSGTGIGESKIAEAEVRPEADVPKVDAPKADEPKFDEPKTDAPKADDPKVDEPKLDEPPMVDEPRADGPDELKVDEAKTGLLEEPKMTTTETEDSKEISITEEHAVPEESKEEIQKWHDQLETNDFKPSEDVEKAHKPEQPVECQESAEPSRIEMAESETQQGGGAEEIGRPLPAELEGHNEQSHTEDLPVAAITAIQHVEANTFSRDIAVQHLSVTPSVDLPTVNAESNVTPEPSTTEVTITPTVTTDGGPPKVTPIVENQYTLGKTEVLATTGHEEGLESLNESTLKGAVDESTLGAAASEDSPMVAADEAVPGIASDQDPPAIVASKGKSTAPVDGGIARTTADKDGATIIANEEVPVVTIDDDSSPFPVHSLKTDIHHPEEITEAHADGIDNGKSTSFEDPLINGTSSSNLKSRVTSTVERPVTPTSIHAALSGKESHNFFKVFWRTVFVDWIGGLIRQIFGGRRRS
jgi:hypothetical protein